MEGSMRVPLPPLASPCLLPASVPAQVAFSPPTAYNAGAIPEALAAHDLDRDGDVDLTVVDRQGHLRLLLNDGRGCFDAAIHALNPPSRRPATRAAARVDPR
jgi:hypothetical protein